MLLKASYLLVVLASLISCGFAVDTITQTTCGPVQGAAEDDALAFKGIPYAVPPLVHLRWKPPVPLNGSKCWSGTLNAQRFGSKCFQADVTYASKVAGDEDCLFLNVWTPTTNKNTNLPVMVWIHGGCLTMSSGSESTYRPSAKLAKDLNMVFVSMNYRLNAFGFLALDILTAASSTGASGNYGFMDQILALKWVQDNIANFGGNPNQVTIFGQSSGATSIFALLAAPQTSGLFHRAWMLSGSPVLNKTLAEASADNMVFLQRTACRDLDCLNHLSAKDIMAAIPWDEYPYWGMGDLLDLPNKGQFDGALAIVDGDVLKLAPFDAWRAGQIVDVPLMIGTLAQEVDIAPVVMDIKTWSLNNYTTYIRAKLEPFGNDIANKALALYPAQPPNTAEYLFTTMATDVRVTCGNDVMSQHAADSFKSPVFRYIGTSRPSEPVNAMGSPFAAEYSFHVWDSFAFLGTIDQYIMKPKASDIAFQNLMQREMKAFAITGAPVSSAWTPYSNATALLDTTMTVVKSYARQKCKFWLANGFFSYSWIN